MPKFNKRAITELLKTFTKPEVKEFKKYITYKGGKINAAMWAILSETHPRYDLTDKELYHKIRPKQDYNDRVYRIWVSELTNLARGFVAAKEFEKDKLLWNNTISKALLERRVPKLGQKALYSQTKALSKIAQPNAEFYTYYFQHETVGYQYVTRFDHHAITDSLQKAVNYLDYSYIVHKLRFHCSIHNRCRILKEEYTLQMEEQLLDFLLDNPQEDKPLIHLYYLLLLLLRDIDAREVFTRFLAYFKAHRQTIDPNEERQLATAALNFCFWNIHRGYLNYLAPRLEIAKIMVDEGFVLINGQMPVYHFRNMVDTAIAADDLDWASTFIHTWLPKVVKEHQPYLKAYNMAYLHFARGEYEAQSRWMQQMEQEDFNFLDAQDEIAFRILKLKTAYKQLGPKSKPRTHQAFFAQLESFRSYLFRRKKVAENTKASAKNFQKALHQLHQRKQGKASKVGDLREYMLDLNPLRELPWLLAELE